MTPELSSLTRIRRASKVLKALDHRTEHGRATLRALSEPRLAELRQRHSVSWLAGTLRQLRVSLALGLAAVVGAVYGAWGPPLQTLVPYPQAAKAGPALAYFGGGLWLLVFGYVRNAGSTARLQRQLEPLTHRRKLEQVWNLGNEIAACQEYLSHTQLTGQRRLIQADEDAVLHLARQHGWTPRPSVLPWAANSRVVNLAE